MTLNPNVTGWLVYNEATPLPAPALIDAFEPFDDFTLVPYDHQPLYEKVDYSFSLDMKMDNLGDGANYAFFNDLTYVRPKVPTLYSALTSGSMATNPAIYGTNTNPFVLEKDQVVEIVLNSMDPGKHPFHLHGHTFQAIVRSAEEAGIYVNNETFPEFPMRRDTFMVNPNGNIVLRFKADNPGMSLFYLVAPLPTLVIHHDFQASFNSLTPRARHLALPLPHRMARRFRPHRHPHRISPRTPTNPFPRSNPIHVSQHIRSGDSNDPYRSLY